MWYGYLCNKSNQVDFVDSEMYLLRRDSMTISNKSGPISSNKCKKSSTIQLSGRGHLSLAKDFKTKCIFSSETDLYSVAFAS